MKCEVCNKGELISRKNKTILNNGNYSLIIQEYVCNNCGYVHSVELKEIK